MIGREVDASSRKAEAKKNTKQIITNDYEVHKFLGQNGHFVDEAQSPLAWRKVKIRTTQTLLRNGSFHNGPRLKLSEQQKDYTQRDEIEPPIW